MSGIIIRDLDQTRVKFEATVTRVGAGDAIKAFSRAINHEGRKAFTLVKRTLRQQTSIPRPMITEATRLKSSTTKNLRAVIEGRGRAIPSASSSRCGSPTASAPRCGAQRNASPMRSSWRSTAVTSSTGRARPAFQSKDVRPERPEGDGQGRNPRSLRAVRQRRRNPGHARAIAHPQGLNRQAMQPEATRPGAGGPSACGRPAPPWPRTGSPDARPSRAGSGPHPPASCLPCLAVRGRRAGQAEAAPLKGPSVGERRLRATRPPGFRVFFGPIFRF